MPVRKRFPGASRGGAENAELEHPIGFVPSCETIGGAVRAELGLGVPKGPRFRRPADRLWQNVRALRERSWGSLTLLSETLPKNSATVVRPGTGGSQTSGNDVLRIPQATA